MQLSPIEWQSLTIEYAFSQSLESVRFLDFQSKAKQAIQQLIQADFGAALILKSETLPAFFSEITAFFSEQEAHYVLKTEFNYKSLFGHAIYLERQAKVETVFGAVHQADNGVLILNLNALLTDLSQWDKLKQALLFQQYEMPCSPNFPQQLPLIQTQFKLVLLGSRDEIATLFAYDDSLYQFCQYAEIDSYLTLDEENIEKWGHYIQTSSKKMANKLFSSNGLNQLLQQYIRESENQKLISISPSLLNKYLSGLSQYYANQTEFDDIQCYFEMLEKQSAVLNQFVLDDILSNQLYIATEDEEIGQINGLSIVEFDGVPYAFGEPLRISCNVQYGEGEIHDIERKVELGGNIHSKGILLAQSCLANLLELPTQLPFSANLAFEQSYGEIDGDSSSLAIFCVLMSALTKLALPQSIAVTGAIDQFGNVLSVGGVNQKIEGFFNVCQMRGLTGKQGVMIPAVCLSHLSLKPEVLKAIKTKQFHIYAVADVFDALQILLNHVFYDEDLAEKADKESLYSLVHKGIRSEDTSGSLWQKICKRLFY